MLSRNYEVVQWRRRWPLHVRCCNEKFTFAISSPDEFLLFYGRPMEQGRPLYFYRVVSIFFFFFLLFSSPDLSCRRVDVYDTSAHGVALVRI